MSVTLKIEGMKCMHCVDSVKTALKEVNGVNQVDVSLENGTATVECDDTVGSDTLKEAIENIGFDVV